MTSPLAHPLAAHAQAVQVLIRKVYEAHAESATGDVDALITEARRLGVDAPDVLRRLADLRCWKGDGRS